MDALIRDDCFGVFSVGGLSGLLIFFLSYLKRNMFFSFWYRTWRSNRDVSLIKSYFLVLGSSVSSFYILFPWITLIFLGIYERMICFLTVVFVVSVLLDFGFHLRSWRIDEKGFNSLCGWKWWFAHDFDSLVIPFLPTDYFCQSICYCGEVLCLLCVSRSA